MDGALDALGRASVSSRISRDRAGEVLDFPHGSDHPTLGEGAGELDLAVSYTHLTLPTPAWVTTTSAASKQASISSKDMKATVRAARAGGGEVPCWTTS